MSFTKLKATRNAKTSYVNPPALQNSAESSAIRPEVTVADAVDESDKAAPVEQEKADEANEQQSKSHEQVAEALAYKSLPKFLEVRTSETSGRGLWTKQHCQPGKSLSVS
jgi:hypothetical protein